MLYQSQVFSDAESAEEVLASKVAKYQNIEGFTHSIDYLEDCFIEKTEIDYAKVDLKEITALLGTPEEEAKQIRFISFKKSKEALEEAGYVEITDSNFHDLTRQLYFNITKK